jgi:predicted PurR-regulated permease PerM
LLDGERIGRGALWLAPPGIRPRVLAIARRAGPMIFRYVGGIVIIMIYATLLTFGVTRYLLHVEHALILAIAVGFLELIPMIGPVLSIGLIAILAIEQLTFWGIIGVALFATALRVTIDQFVAPIVLGKSVDLPPPVIIFGFLAGGALWGVLGVIVAIPVAALVKIILQEVYGDGQRDGVK